MNKARVFYITNESDKSFNFKGYTILTSGGYDPIHPGHISYLMDAKLKGAIETLSTVEKIDVEFNPSSAFYRCKHVAVVNGDWFLTQKKGRPFMPLKDRCQIVAGIKGVDIVIGLDTTNDMTVNRALELVKPSFFAKGGDRTGIENIPEWETCQKLGIKVLTEIGVNKDWSSSNYLAEWGAQERNIALSSLDGFLGRF